MWSEVVWPEWAPTHVREELEQMWAVSGPGGWQSDAYAQRVPSLGNSPVSLPKKDGTSMVVGNLIHLRDRCGFVVDSDGIAHRVTYPYKQHLPEPEPELDQTPEPAPVETLIVKHRALGCPSCDIQFTGPTGSVDPKLSDDEAWAYLRAEAEAVDFVYVAIGGRSAFCCSRECAAKWVAEPEPYDDSDYQLYLDERARNFKPRAVVVKAKLSAIPIGEVFTIPELLRVCQEETDQIEYQAVLQVLKAQVRHGTVTKEGYGRQVRRYTRIADLKDGRKVTGDESEEN